MTRRLSVVAGLGYDGRLDGLLRLRPGAHLHVHQHRQGDCQYGRYSGTCGPRFDRRSPCWVSDSPPGARYYLLRNDPILTSQLTTYSPDYSDEIANILLEQAYVKYFAVMEFYGAFNA